MIQRHLGLVSVLALAGCMVGQGPGAQQEGLQFRVSGPNDCGLDRFAITVEGAGGTSYGPEVHYATPSQLADVEDLDLPDDIDVESGLYAVGDLFIPLEAGSYDVQITAQDLTGSGSWEDVETRPEREVAIEAGATTEIGEVFSCEGEAVGALDVVIVVNNGPDILDFWYDPDKFTPACGSVDMTAAFDDVNDSSLEVTWEVFDELGDDGSPDPATLLETWSDSGLPSIIAEPTQSTFTYECTTPGTNYVLVTVTDDAGMDTTFWTMVHCYTPVADNVCLDAEIGLTVAGTCNPDFPRTGLDSACVEALLGPLDPPLCTELCPDYPEGGDDGGGDDGGGDDGGGDDGGGDDGGGDDGGGDDGGGDDGSLIVGNARCSALGHPKGFKIDGIPVEGAIYTLTSDDGELEGLASEQPDEWVRIDALHHVGGEAKGLDWSASRGMDAVLLKAGPRASAYSYDPEAFAGTGLYTWQQTYEISHVTFCYDHDGGHWND